MSLPASQQRTLERIERWLRESDPRLTSLFGIFNRLCRAEAMPWMERVKARPVADRVAWTVRRFRLMARPAARIRILLLLPAALAATVCAIMIAVGFPGSGRTSPAPKHPARELVIKPRLLTKAPLCRFGARLAPASC